MPHLRSLFTRIMHHARKLPGFRKNAPLIVPQETTHTITHNQRRLHVIATTSPVHHSDPHGPQEIALKLPNNTEVAAFWVAPQKGGADWMITHRKVEEPHRGSSYGKLGFELCEKLVKERRGKKIGVVAGADQPSTIGLALTKGYTIAPQSEPTLRRILILSTDEPIPPRPIIIAQLKAGNFAKIKEPLVLEKKL